MNIAFRTQQLAHAGVDGDCLGLACGEKPFIKGFQDRVAAHGHQRGHTENSTQMRLPTPAGSSPLELAAVPAQGRHPNERRNLLVRQRAELRQTRQEDNAEGWANSGHAAQEIFSFPPQGALPQPVGEVSSELLQLAFQDGEHPVDAALTRGNACWRRCCSVTFIRITCRRRVTSASSSRAAAGASGCVTVSLTSPKCAITAASSRSVLANLPWERANSRTFTRTCRGFTIATGMPAVPMATTNRISYPPVASKTTTWGCSSRAAGRGR